MSAPTKAEMAELLADKMELSRREAKDLVEVFFEQIAQALISGREVKLSGFGNFELKDKNSRPGRNPKTGEPVAVSARRVVTFKTGQKFRQKVDERLFDT